jgi:AcrR family transcriptional regulator
MNDVSGVAEDMASAEAEVTQCHGQVLQVTDQQLDKIRQMMRFLVTKNYADKVKPFENFSSSRADVLVSSVEVFLKKGIDASTVQDLLDQADVSRRTFYKYFKNKNEVVEAIYSLLVGMLETRYQEEMQEMQSAKDLMDRCIDVFFDYQQALGPVVLMLNQRAMSGVGAISERRRLAQKNLVSMLDEQMYRLHGIHYDPWIFYGLVWAAENALHHLLTYTQVSSEDVHRCKAAIQCIFGSVILRGEAGEQALPVPLAKSQDQVFA